MSQPSAPASASELLSLFRRSGLYDEAAFRDCFPTDDDVPATARDGAAALVRAGLLTNFQAKQLLAGRHRGFTLGTHRILEPIGQGGMGTVFLAEHTSLKRRVAIKVLPADKAKDRLSLERFYREARAAAALSHQNIVGLHDVSQGGGVHFLVMEYVEGNDLQSLMAKTGPLHPSQAVSYIAQAAEGLRHAHSKGIVHRDIKPANLILSKGGVVKILDLGLARSLHTASDDLTGQLGDGETAGTADYIAPEQALAQAADERADIYSLGATLYALVAGHPPFSGTTSQKLMQHQLKDPPNLARKLSGRVPQALADVVVKMMAKRPSERYQSCEEVVEALGPWLPAPSTGSIVAVPLSSATAAALPPHRGAPEEAKERGVPGWAWGVGAGFLLAVTGGVWAIAGGSKPAPEPQPTVAVNAPTPAPALPPAPKPAPPSPDVLRTPLAPEPGDERFVPVSFAGVANVPSDRLKFDPGSSDSLQLDDWGDRRVEGVPFRLVPPRGGEPNVLEFYSRRGAAGDLPKSATVPVGVAAERLHFLGGVSAWGHPFKSKDHEGHEEGTLVLTVVVRYADGKSEEHKWENGVHFSDYNGQNEVPGSTHALSFKLRKSVRYLAIEPRHDAVITEIEFVRNADDPSIPIMLAMTAEKRTGEPGADKPKADAPPAARAVIPIELPAGPKPTVVAPAGPVTADGVSFAPPANGGVALVSGPPVKLGCFVAAKGFHVLGSVPTGGLVKVTLQYAGGKSETHDWRPGAGTDAGGGLRVLPVTPGRKDVVQYLTLENAGPGTPAVFAVAAETL